MARDEAPPFARGETYANGSSEILLAASGPFGLGGINLEGKEFVFEPNADAQSVSYNSLGADPSGRAIRVRVVRNVSGVNLKPARLVTYSKVDPYETRTDGYTFALGDRVAGVVDEFLPAAGVPDQDLFYLVIDGPTQFTQLSASSSVLAIGDRLVPGSGTSKTNDDAGRVVAQDLTGATATLANNVQNAVGYAAIANNSVENAKFAGIAHGPSR